jgi:hypothetical protein
VQKRGIEWVAVQMRQVYADYHLCIDPHVITIDEIRFFYEPEIDGLCKLQKMKEKK